MSGGFRGLPEFTNLFGAAGAPVTAGMWGVLGLCGVVGKWSALQPAPVPAVSAPAAGAAGGGGIAPWPENDLYSQFGEDYDRLIAFREWCDSRKGKPGKKRRRPVHSHNVGPKRATSRRTGTTKVMVPDDVPEPEKPVVNHYYVVNQGVNAKWLLVGIAVGAVLVWAYTHRSGKKRRTGKGSSGRRPRSSKRSRR